MVGERGSTGGSTERREYEEAEFERTDQTTSKLSDSERPNKEIETD